MTITEFKSAY